MTHPPPAKPAPTPKRPFTVRFNDWLQKVLVRLRLDEVPHIKRIIITVVGVTVILFGIVLIVTPGPAVLVIPAGLAILGTEYAWARRWLRQARQMTRKAVSQTQLILSPRPPETPEEIAQAREVNSARGVEPPR